MVKIRIAGSAGSAESAKNVTFTGSSKEIMGIISKPIATPIVVTSDPTPIAEPTVFKLTNPYDFINHKIKNDVKNDVKKSGKELRRMRRSDKRDIDKSDYSYLYKKKRK
jgi:hypothetical protein